MKNLIFLATIAIFSLSLISCKNNDIKYIVKSINLSATEAQLTLNNDSLLTFNDSENIKTVSNLEIGKRVILREIQSPTLGKQIKIVPFYGDSTESQWWLERLLPLIIILGGILISLLKSS